MFARLLASLGLVHSLREQNISITYVPDGCGPRTCTGMEIDDALACLSSLNSSSTCRALLRWDYKWHSEDQECPYQSKREVFCVPGNKAVGSMFLSYVEAIGPIVKPDCIPTYNLTAVYDDPYASSEFCGDTMLEYPKEAIKSDIYENEARSVRFVLPQETALEHCYRIGYDMGSKECSAIGIPHNNTQVMIVHAYKYFGYSLQNPVFDDLFDYTKSQLPLAGADNEELVN